jgi:hypothetical protein
MQICDRGDAQFYQLIYRSSSKTWEHGKKDGCGGGIRAFFKDVSNPGKVHSTRNPQIPSRMPMRKDKLVKSVHPIENHLSDRCTFLIISGFGIHKVCGQPPNTVYREFGLKSSPPPICQRPDLPNQSRRRCCFEQKRE